MSKPVVGIIAEYNPLHSGHVYHLRKAKELSGADCCVIAMSGDFVQRGAPAVYDKYTRTQMALAAGADLVLEIPPIFATSSAEDFAACGVALLARSGIVSHLCFGSECGDMESLSSLAHILCEESPCFSSNLKEFLRQGRTYPQARAKALALTHAPDRSRESEAASLLSSPNNLLAIEYLKALIRRGDCGITPLTLKRAGSGYHSPHLHGPKAVSSDELPYFASASALRRVLLSEQPLSDRIRIVSPQVPAVLKDLFSRSLPLSPDDFSTMLSYRLLELERQAFPLEAFLDVSRELAFRLKRQLLDFSTFEKRIEALKTRQYTYTRVSRGLLHILLNMTTQDYLARKNKDYVSCLRVLGFRRASAWLLKEIKARSSLPIITKTADAGDILSSEARNDFLADLLCSHIYQSVLAVKRGGSSYNEYTRSVMISD